MYSLAYCLVLWSKAPSACPRAGTLSIPARLVGRLGFRSKVSASYSIIALIQHYTSSWVGQGSVVRVSASYGKCCNIGSKVIDPPGDYSYIQPSHFTLLTFIFKFQSQFTEIMTFVVFFHDSCILRRSSGLLGVKTILSIFNRATQYKQFNTNPYPLPNRNC